MPNLSLVPALPTSQPRQVWDRQPHDTDKSWRAFAAYRDMGPDRTYGKTAEATGIKDRQWINQWSHRHDWRGRAAAYDTDNDQQLQAKMLAKRWKIAEQASQIADAFLSRVVQRLRTTDVANLDMSDLVAMTRLAVGIQRDVHFPRADTGVQINAIAQIVIDPLLLPAPTGEPPARMVIDGNP